MQVFKKLRITGKRNKKDEMRFLRNCKGTKLI